MVLRLSKERDEIYVDANDVFFLFFGLRRTQRTSTGVQPLVLGHWLGITDTMVPVPLEASTAPQSAVLALGAFDLHKRKALFSSSSY